MFTDKCLDLIENTSRVETRQEFSHKDNDLNEDELSVDVSVTETFGKVVLKASPQIFNRVFEKVKNFTQGKIMETGVSGYILAGMVKSLVTVQPAKTLSFYVPHICERIEVAIKERADVNRTDMELQSCLVILTEVRIIKQHIEGGTAL